MHEKSKNTKIIEALNQLMQKPHSEFDQYRATAFIMDAVFDTNDLNQLTYKTLRGAKGNLQKAFGVSTLHDYVQQKGLDRIEPFLAAQGDMIIALDDEHDDVAFCAGTRWVYFDDEDALQHDRFSVKHFSDVDMIAYRI
ncbi:TPA: hypothetical protein SIA39_004003 [Aeromonas sobria]|nr:hypothetical protein [Aeromonas sobria]